MADPEGIVLELDQVAVAVFVETVLRVVFLISLVGGASVEFGSAGVAVERTVGGLDGDPEGEATRRRVCTSPFPPPAPQPHWAG